jgi:chromosome segregation ATPase
VAPALETIDRRFDAIDRRLEALEAELVEFRRDVLEHFDALYGRLERLEQEHVAVTQGLRRIEAALLDDRRRREQLERDVAALRENVAVLRTRIEDIERRLSS